MIVLARQVVTGEVDLEALRDEPDAHALAMLLGLGGVGRWSAEYALLRGLGRHHVLPGDDVGARNSLRRRFGLDPRSGYDAVADLARAWWPYGGLVYFHLVFDTLVTAGHLAASRSEFATSPPGPSIAGRVRKLASCPPTRAWRAWRGVHPSAAWSSSRHAWTADEDRRPRHAPDRTGPVAQVGA